MVVKRLAIAFLAAILTIVSGCHHDGASLSPGTTNPQAQTNEISGPSANQSDSKGASYTPPTAEEMAPMRPEYLAELVKIQEPPEMAGSPMQVRKAVSPSVLKLQDIVSGAIRTPEKATHDQRATSIRKLLEVANSNERNDGIDRAMTYGAIATIACIDGVDPQTIIGYASNATDDSDEALVLRARMYLKIGEQNKALNDLEKIMTDGNGHALAGGDVNPRNESVKCGWSIADFDALGDDPRALAAKGLYLSSFIGYGAEGRKTVKESTIRDLYARSASSWHSPIPHLLSVTLDCLGSEQSMARAGCIRANGRNVAVTSIGNSCAKFDEGVRQEIRELTMALVIQPKFARALTERASKYLQLAEGAYADGKPSRQLYELAIGDFTASIEADSKDKHMLYCDRALAQASIGKYQDAVAGYAQGMKYANNGIEDSPFVYEQLAGLYMKIGKFNEAADVLTQGIIHSSGGGLDAVIFSGGMKAFRTLYPEYELLPDEILAEDVRRRHQPQLPKSWDAEFTSRGEGTSKGRITSSILPEMYVLRGDAYMKSGRRAEALADYQRVKSDAWYMSEQSGPRFIYFNERGSRKSNMPVAWPPSPSKL